MVSEGVCADVCMPVSCNNMDYSVHIYTSIQTNQYFLHGSSCCKVKKKKKKIINKNQAIPKSPVRKDTSWWHKGGTPFEQTKIFVKTNRECSHPQ